jgi:hypothetical protein
MAKKILLESYCNQNMQTELSKSKNYLSKLVGEYEAQRESDEKMMFRLKEKSKGFYE